jgi:hypothetical protein
MTDAPKNEFDDLVRRAKGHHVQPLTPGEKAGILWAEGELKRLREAVEWACENMTRMEGEDVEPFVAELRRKAKEGN